MADAAWLLFLLKGYAEMLLAIMLLIKAKKAMDTIEKTNSDNNNDLNENLRRLQYHDDGVNIQIRI